MDRDSRTIIHVSHLKKSFKQLEVLKDISVDIREGEVSISSLYIYIQKELAAKDGKTLDDADIDV